MKSLFSLLLFPSMIVAQTTIHGVIVNAHREPLPFTNIVSLSQRTGTETNETGKFILPGIMQEDSLRISNIAYSSRVMTARDLLANDTIVLAENIKQLNPIVLKNLSFYNQEISIGYTSYSKNGSFSMGPGDQLATYIPNPEGKEGWIRGVEFKVKEFGTCKNGFRIRLLSSDPIQFRPSTDLLDENIIILPGDVKKSNYVDLSAYKIMLPKEGIFIVVEWLGTDTDCNENSYSSILSNISIPNNIVWFNYRDGTWSREYRPRLPNGNYNTPNVGLKVAY